MLDLFSFCRLGIQIRFFPVGNAMSIEQSINNPMPVTLILDHHFCSVVRWRYWNFGHLQGNSLFFSYDHCFFPLKYCCAWIISGNSDHISQVLDVLKFVEWNIVSSMNYCQVTKIMELLGASFMAFHQVSFVNMWAEIKIMMYCYFKSQ